jgi:hypothetical protein
MGERYPDGLVNGDQTGSHILTDGWNRFPQAGDAVVFYGGEERTILRTGATAIELNAPISVCDNAGIWFNG